MSADKETTNVVRQDQRNQTDAVRKKNGIRLSPLYEGMTTRTLMLCLLLVSCPSMALAQAVALHGLGNNTCGEAMQQTARSGQRQEAAYADWLGGNITGYNVAVFNAGKTDAMVGAGMSFDTLTAVFKSKCSQDATKRVVQAAQEIYQDLAKRR